MNTDQLRPGRLTGAQRSAGLLIALGPELAGKVLAQFGEHEIERLCWEITNLSPLAPPTYDALLEEACEAVSGDRQNRQGGIESAMEILEAAVGEDKSRAIGERIRRGLQEVPFAFVQELDPGQLAAFLVVEHPQTIALVLSNISPRRGAAIMSQLPADIRSDVALRIARLESSAPEVISEIEAQMQRRLSSSIVSRRKTSQAGGIDSLVSLLKGTDRQTEQSILAALAETDPDLVDAIKQQMFVFENITQLDDRSIQRVLREVDGKDLAVALKGASEDVRAAVLRNMSSRAAAMLEEDLAVMGAVRLSTVEASQGNIVAVIRRLDDAEEIVISRGDLVE